MNVQIDNVEQLNSHFVRTGKRGSPSRSASFKALSASTQMSQNERAMALFKTPKTTLTREEIAIRAGIPYASATRVVAALLAADRLVERGEIECRDTGSRRGIVGLRIAIQMDIPGLGAA